MQVEILNFNPRSHKGNDITVLGSSLCSLISIHVPTRGTTIVKPIWLTTVIISIHVPTRGTTGIDSRRAGGDDYFNPRSHKGNDNGDDHLGYILTQFQSTFPQGERPYASFVFAALFYFNPRSHKGNDLRDRDINLAGDYFNPRSHKGNDFVYIYKRCG